MDSAVEIFFFLGGVALFVGTLVAIGIANGAKWKASMAEQQVRQLQQHVAWLDGWVRHVATQLQRADAELARIAAAGPSGEIRKPDAAPTPAPGALAPPMSDTGSSGSTDPTAAQPPAALAPDTAAALAQDATAALAQDAAALVHAAALAPDTAAARPPDAAAPQAASALPPDAAAPAAAPPATLEEQLGIVWLTRVGAGVFVLGALFFFKYAVDNSWIGPMGRVAVGGLVGLALLVGAESARPKTKPAFVSALTGIGLAVLFASVWASSAFYNLVSPSTAFVASTAVLLLGAALAARHKAETTLVVSLGAGLLNPVVLSTGKDQPVALFAYLVLITSVTMVVASHLRIEEPTRPDAPRGFQVAPWIAVVGTIAIFVGWYARFFDIDDRRGLGIDAPAETLVGAYLSLPSRAAPLVFVFVTAAEWIAAAFWYRARHREGRFEVVLTIVALVVGHVTSTMILYDSPRAFGGAAILLGVGSILVLGRLRATQLLLVPMGAAFMALIVVSGRVEPSARITLIVVLGAWAGVYVVGLLRDSAISRVAAWRASAALGLFLCLSAIVLVRSNPALLVLVVAGTTATVLVLAHKSKEEQLLGAASVVALGFVWVTSAAEGYRVADVPWALLGAAAIASVVVLAGAGLFLRRAFGAWVLGAVSAATLAWVGAVVLATWSEVSMLRALAAAGAGIIDLGVGAWVLGAARPGERRYANVLVGQSLALFAAAVAFSQAGATITVLWALLAVVAASAAAKTRDPEWVVIALGLYAVTVGRALFVDTRTTWEITSTFINTMGREGELTVAAFRNARTYGLAASGLSLLAGARLLAREDGKPEPTVAPALAAPTMDRRHLAGAMVVLAYALLVALLIIEVRVAATTLPPPPGVPLDYAEWDVFHRTLEAALTRQRGALSMFTTLVLAVSASALLVVGFAARDALHRYLGLVTFTIALGKLAVWDVWMIERIYQIVLFIGTGGLLVAGGFLYARFGKRIVKLVRDGTAAGVFLLALTTAGPAEAAPHADITHAALVRAIDPVPGPGDYRVEVDLDLYRQSRAEGLLSDVRIVDEEQREVPYVIQAIDTVHAPPPVVADFLDPGTGSDGTAVATWKMSGGPHCKVKLDLRGENFVRRVRVETGDTVTSLRTVSDSGYVFKVEGPSRVERDEVSYPRSLATFVRVTLAADETRSAVVAIRSGTFSCEPAWAMPATTTLPLKIEETHTDEARKTTIVTLDAGASGAPISALTLDIAGDGELRRSVSITATNYREAWPSAGSGVIYRLRPRPSALLEERSVPVSSSKRWFRLEIANEDSAPLVVRAVQAEVPTRQIVFRAANAGPHRLFIGDPKATPPRYDLSSILAQKEDGPPAPKLALAAALPNPRHGEQPKPPDPPFTEQHRSAIGLVLAVLLGALSLWAVRLLRKPA